MSTVADLSERDLIARLRVRLTAPPPWLVVGIGDDAAVVEHERNHLDVLTVDAIVDGVHFDRAFTPPSAIGHRALAVNLSDLAAMGAKPRLVLLSLALPQTLALDDFDGIVTAFSALAALHQVHVVGGNLTRTPGPLTIDVTAIGVARRRHILERRGAHAGDELYVTGEIGGARAGLAYLQARRDGHSPEQVEMLPAVQRYLYPNARTRAGLLVGRNHAASACMDLSDGLWDAVSQVTEASGVGATLDAAVMPIEAAVRGWFIAGGADPVAEALRGGDDYELLFAVSRRTRRAFHQAIRLSGTAVTRIGVCGSEPGVRVDGLSGTAALEPGFRHFR